MSLNVMKLADSRCIIQPEPVGVDFVMIVNY